MTLLDILKKELIASKHYYVCEMALYDPSIRCKHGFWLCKIDQDRITYDNRHGPANLPAADPHFFDKLRKLLAELCKRSETFDKELAKKLKRRSGNV